MTNLLQKLKRLLAPNTMDETGNTKPDQNRVSDEPLHLTEEALVTLLQRLEQTQENAYSCEEVFALLDEYVELVASDEEAAQLMPFVKNHVDSCADCTVVYEALLHILKSETTPPSS